MAEEPVDLSQTLIQRAAGNDSDAVEQLLIVCRPFIAAVASKYSGVDAKEDLAHDFITHKILRGKILNKYIPEKGSRFPGWLRTCVSNFCRSQLKRKKINIERVDVADLELTSESPNVELEDVVFVRSVLTEVWRRLRQECVDEGRLLVWQDFFDHVLSVIYLGETPPNKSDCPKERKALSNRIITAQRKAKRLLNHVRHQLGGDDRFFNDKVRFRELILKSFNDIELHRILMKGDFFDDQLDRMFMSTRQQTRDQWVKACESPIDQQQSAWLEIIQSDAESFLNDGLERNLDLSAWLFESQVTVDDVMFGGLLSQTRRLRQVAKDKSRATQDANSLCFFALYMVLTARLTLNSGQRESSLNTFQLTHNFQQCLEFEWLDDESKSLIQQAANLISEESCV